MGNGQVQISQLRTHFASPERADERSLRESIALVASSPITTQILDAVGGSILVLNAERQIVAANLGATATLGVTSYDLTQALGLRPGEALGCVHVNDAPSGCGTGMACASCGAARAIVDVQQSGMPVEHDCLLRVQRNGAELAQEFRVRASLVEMGGIEFVLFVLHDISDRKRRESLERTFFHDLSSTLGALQAYYTLLTESAQDESRILLERLGLVVDRLLSEVHSHRDLIRAEAEQLPVQVQSCCVSEIFRALQVCLADLATVENCRLEFGVATLEIATDRALLLRVLTNMITNAIEASGYGGTVRVDCEDLGESVRFTVRNPGRIQPEVARRIFTRSFSTKAAKGRGLGTYGMKLFGERYLRGRVTFECDEESTLFCFQLPKHRTPEAASMTRLRVF